MLAHLGLPCTEKNAIARQMEQKDWSQFRHPVPRTTLQVIPGAA
jgi:hypothetical protein